MSRQPEPPERESPSDQWAWTQLSRNRIQVLSGVMLVVGIVLVLLWVYVGQHVIR